jgi:hypothetical protein
MIHFTSVLLIGILPLLMMAGPEQQRPLLTIDFSLDSKPNGEMGHTSIQYFLTEKGEEFDVRNVHDWAFQASHHRELSKSSVRKIVVLLRQLPDPEEENIPRDWLVTLTFRDGNYVKVCEYYRKRLPRALKEVLELLGGIRFELKDTIGFSST